MSSELGLIGPIVGIIFNLILLITYLRITEAGKLNWMLFGSIFFTVIIFSIDVALKTLNSPTLSTLYLFEILRNLAWFSLLLNILGVNSDIFTSTQLKNNRNLVTLALVAVAVPCVLL